MGANKPANWVAGAGDGGAGGTTAGEGGGGEGAASGTGLAVAAAAAARGLRGTSGSGLFSRGAGDAANAVRFDKLTLITLRTRAADTGEEGRNGSGADNRWLAITPAINPWAASEAAIAVGIAHGRRGLGTGSPAAAVAARAK